MSRHSFAHQLGTTFQREFSLLDGKPREHPIDPVRREPGVVRIGNQLISVRTPQSVSDDRKSLEDRRRFVRAFAKRQNHECAATLAGEFCGHLL